jgi:polyvinyl alcohol dehydrogenase (cytochrome)
MYPSSVLRSHVSLGSNRHIRFRSLLAVSLLGGVLALAITTRPSAGAPFTTSADWPVSGQNLSNTRYQAAETIVGVTNVGTLTPKWSSTLGGDVSATPAVVGGALYVPSWDGKLSNLDTATGATIWSHAISEYNGLSGSISRTSPAVSGNTVFIGTLDGADMIAVDAATGNRIWITQLDPQPQAAITQAPVVYNGVVYVGVSSSEEVAALSRSYKCCTFRGSIIALDAVTGRVLWQTFTVPPNAGQPGGYSGAAVWSSTPVVDRERNSLYITTGDNYSVPASVSSCLKQGGGAACNAVNDYFDAVLALDLTTGAVKWVARTHASDTWNEACIRGPRANCSQPSGTDDDFGAGANLFQATINGHLQTVVGAGQKSGIYWAIDPDTGAVLWSTKVGPDGGTGGIQWGTATDGTRIYVAIANSDHQAYTLVPSGQTVTGGAWSALDPATGRILWQTADPHNAVDVGPVTVANGVVYAGAVDRKGHMYALNAATGAIRWTFASGGSVAGGPAISNGVIYWGSGYPKNGGTSSHTLYAFSVGASTVAGIGNSDRVKLSAQSAVTTQPAR